MDFPLFNIMQAALYFLQYVKMILDVLKGAIIRQTAQEFSYFLLCCFHPLSFRFDCLDGNSSLKRS